MVRRGAMRYDVRILDGTGSRFELKREKRLAKGEMLRHGSIVYRVTAILPSELESFDAVAVVEWRATPAVAHRGSGFVV